MSIGSTTSRPFLEIKDLSVRFETDDGIVQAVSDSTFSLEKGKTLGIVGESGSGKSVTSLAVLGLHRTRSNAKVSGEIWLDDEELVTATDEQVRKLRGGKMAMIFQDPLSAMHPFFTVGSQIVEAYRLYNNVSKKVARKHAIDLLGRVAGQGHRDHRPLAHAAGQLVRIGAAALARDAHELEQVAGALACGLR